MCAHVCPLINCVIVCIVCTVYIILLYMQERQGLLDRLTTSEQLLEDSAATIDNLKIESSKQQEEQQLG